MRVNEIFYSLSGEGVHAGIPTVFVRLTGCNLQCDYCDTKYAQGGGKEMSITRVVKSVCGLRPKSGRWVLITGGEPLQQPGEVFELVSYLKSLRSLIEVETNGSIDPPSWFGDVDCWSVDVKCPSSGPSYGSFRERWLRRLRKQDQLKFVVGNEEDLDFVKGFLNGTSLKPTVLVSPVMPSFDYGKFGIDRFKVGESTVVSDKDLLPILQHGIWLQEVAEFCKEQDVRMSLQLHKVIWGDKVGV